MRLMFPIALAATVMATSPSIAESPYERQVLAALNQARAQPAAFAERLRAYRQLYHGNIVRQPGQPVDLMTEEGVAPVDEAIRFLGRQHPFAPVASGMLLEAAAADHTIEQGQSGAVGHGRSGATPDDRLQRHGGGRYVAEVIAYGSNDPEDVVRQLIIDDGVADRGHRALLFSDRYRFAGVSCGRHPAYRTMCVIDMAETADGRDPAESYRVAMR